MRTYVRSQTQIKNINKQGNKHTYIRTSTREQIQHDSNKRSNTHVLLKHNLYIFGRVTQVPILIPVHDRNEFPFKILVLAPPTQEKVTINFPNTCIDWMPQQTTS